jgi:3-deoxy-D-manno-octulosonic-acid transferase
MAIFVKYEVWHNFFQEIHQRNIPLILVSAIFRKDQVYFKPFGNWFRKSLQKVDHIFTQDDDSFNLLDSIGVKNATVAGDTRFDRVKQVADAAKQIPELRDFSSNSLVLVAGSTWPDDEAVLLDHFQDNEKIKLIVVPHEIGKKHINEICKNFDNAVRWSEKEKISPTTSVVVIDAIGFLSSVYQYGHVAYVGGGFGSGIHNTLEPAVFGIPVIFGPRYDKFREARDLIDCKAAFSIDGKEAFSDKMELLSGDDALRKKMGWNAGDYVRSNCGATEKIMGKLNKFRSIG